VVVGGDAVGDAALPQPTASNKSTIVVTNTIDFKAFMLMLLWVWNRLGAFLILVFGCFAMMISDHHCGRIAIT
jgi:hypothetical protein